MSGERVALVLDCSPAAWLRIRQGSRFSSVEDSALPLSDADVAIGLARAVAGYVRAIRALRHCPRDPLLDGRRSALPASFASSAEDGASDVVREAELASSEAESRSGDVNVLLVGRCSSRWAFPESLTENDGNPAGLAGGTKLSWVERITSRSASARAGSSTEAMILEQLGHLIIKEDAAFSSESMASDFSGDAVMDDLSSSISSDGEAALTGGLTKALCLLNSETRSATASTGGSRSGRVLLVTASQERPSEYVPYMNCAFAAEKMGLNIDVCRLDGDERPDEKISDQTEAHLPLLLQVSHLTNGAYLEIPSAHLTQLQGDSADANALAGEVRSSVMAASLMQLLVQWFMPPPSLRSQLTVPLASSLSIDLRTSCFCHGTPLKHGHVCSVCLSVFCRSTTQCSTCGTRFGTPLEMTKPTKRENGLTNGN